MPLEYLKYQPRDYVPAPIEQIQQSVSNISARHDAAVKQQSALEQTLGQLDLNQAEDKWKANYIADVQNKIKGAAEFGNYATALTTAEQQAGKIASDPSLIGRMKYQQDFKKFQDEVQTSQKYDASIKEYALARNKYLYQDTTDEAGKVIGGTRFDAAYKPVEQVDLTSIMGKAMQMAAKDAGGGNTIYYAKADGSMTNNPNESADGLPYMNKSGKFEALTKDKLAAATKALIENTPGAKESIAQDYEVSVWNTKRQSKGDKLPITDATDNQGLLLTEQQYLNKKLDPFYKAASYRHVESTTTPMAGMQAAVQRRRQADAAKEAQRVSRVDTNLPHTVFGQIARSSASASTILGNVKASENSLRNIASNLYTSPADKRVVAAATVEQLARMIPKQLARTGMDDNSKAMILKDLYKNTNDYKSNMYMYNDKISRLTPKEQAAAAFTSAMDNGQDLSHLVANNNEYAKNYVKKINEIWGSKGEELKYNTDNIAEIIRDVDNGITGSHVNLGITVKKDERTGKNYISLNRSHMLNSNILTNAIRKIEPENRLTNIIPFKSDVGIMTVVDNKGNRTSPADTSQFTFNKGIYAERGLRGTRLNSLFGTASNIYKDANSIYTKSVASKTQDYNQIVNAFGDTSIQERAIRNIGAKQGWTDAQINSKLKDLKQSDDNLFNLADGAYLDIYHSQDGKAFKPMNKGTTTHDMLETTKLIKASDAKRVIESYDVVDGQYAKVIKVLPGNNSNLTPELNQGYSLIVKGIVSDDNVKALESMPQFAANVKLTQHESLGYGKIAVNSKSINNAMPETYVHLKDKNYYYNVGGREIPIDRNKALKLLMANDDFTTLKSNVQAVGANRLTNADKQSTYNEVARIVYEQLNIPEGTPFNNLSAEQQGVVNRTFMELDKND